jgi:putative component of toxin-antitoxin plasmid stabilization module
MKQKLGRVWCGEGVAVDMQIAKDVAIKMMCTGDNTTRNKSPSRQTTRRHVRSESTNMIKYNN